MNINDIRDALLDDRYHATDHADERIAVEQISNEELLASVLSGEIIEDYPDDRPFPSCLIYGTTLSAVAVHSVWGYNAQSRYAVLITAYRPDPGRWTDWRIRRPRGDGVE